MTPYQRAFQALDHHIRDCAECLENRGGCDEGKDLADRAYALSPGAARMAAKARRPSVELASLEAGAM